MSRTPKIIRSVILVLFVLFIAPALLVQIPAVQTKLVDKVTGTLKSKTGACISIGKIYFKPVSTVVLRDVSIVDQEPFDSTACDTLGHIDILTVRFTLFGLVGPGHEDVRLKEVKIKGGSFNLVIEPRTIRTNLQRIFGLRPKEVRRPMPEKDILLIKNISIENFRFRLQNYVAHIRKVPDNCVKWGDIDARDIRIAARNYRISHGLFSGTVDDMSFKEKSGWDITRLSGSTVVGKGDVLVNNFHLEDSSGSWADIDYRMTGTSRMYREYVDSVVMTADVHDGRWSLESLARVIPPLNPDPGIFVSITGHAKGTVSDLRADNLKIKGENCNVSVTVDGTMKGLPKIGNTVYDVRFSDISATMRDLSRFVRGVSGKKNIDFSGFGGKRPFFATITAKGPINDLNVTADAAMLRGGSASVNADIGFLLDKSEPIVIKGRLTSKELDLKSLFGTDRLGRITAGTAFSICTPLKHSPLDARIESLDIEKLEFNGYAFRGITGKAALQGRDLTAEIRSDDPALNADASVWSDKYAYNGAIILRHADLNKTHFDSRGRSIVSANIYGRLDKDLKTLQGNANISNITLVNADGPNRIDNLMLSARMDKNGYDVMLDSDIAKASFTGNSGHFNASFKAIDMSPLLEFVLPGLYMDNDTELKADMDSTGFIKGFVKSKRLALGENFVKDINASAEGRMESLAATATAGSIQIAGVAMDNGMITAHRNDSLAYARFTFSNGKGDLREGELNAGLLLVGKDKYKVLIDSSFIGINQRQWTIPPSSVSINGREIEADSVRAYCGDALIMVDGTVSEKRNAKLNAIIDNINLAVTDRFIKKGKFMLKGIVDAKGVLFSPLGEGIPRVVADVRVDSLEIGGVKMGNLLANSYYNKDTESFVMYARDSIGSRLTLDASADYCPERKSFVAKALLDRFPFGFVKIFTPKVFSDIQGFASGEAVFTAGKDKNLSLHTKNLARIDNGLLEVAFTHVPYNINGTFHVDDSGIHLAKMSATDRFNNPTTTKGGLNWNKMKNLCFDLHMGVDRTEVLNIPANDPGAGVFYGQVFGSGTVDITGPLKNIQMDANVRTVGRGDMHILISGNANSNRGNLLTIIDPYDKKVDRYADMLLKKRQKANTGNSFCMNLHCITDPQVQVSLDMGGGGFAAGMRGYGNGTFDMGIGEKYDGFNILGDYTIAEGTFDANANNIVHREFTIKNGSSIKFGGNIFDSDVDLTATYETKASIAALIADTTSVSNRRLIECGIRITDKLANPSIKFTIGIPDLSPSAKSKVESALSTEDKVQKQFLSLLLSNNFLPDVQSGIVNSSSLLYSNVSEIMSNQINNIFDKLNIPLDLGLNYQPSQKGTSIFDVAVSTRLWNNRVIIGGTIGNRQGTSSSSSAIFGDVDIQYKVNKSGSFRIKAFSHSADQYSNYLDNSQRNGLGLSWQQEFNRFADWIRQLFSSREKKEEYATKEVEEYKKVQTFVIDE